MAATDISTTKGKETFLSGETEEQMQPRRDIFCPPRHLHTLVISLPGLYSLAQKPTWKAFGKTLTLIFV